jgi:hypothetical protein
MIELTIEGFLSHCESMGTTEIDHSNWSTCAIGTYLESVGIPVKRGYDYLHNLVPEEYSVTAEQFYSQIPDELKNLLDDKSELMETYQDILEYPSW